MSASELASLERTRALLIQQREDLLTGGPKPTYTVGDRTYQWEAYLRYLSDEIQRVTAQIAELEGPFEILSIAE